MKLIARLFLIVICTYFLPFVMPWWSVVVSALFIGLLLPGHGFSVFISGFLGGGLTWMVYAWYLDTLTHSILSTKVVEFFPFDDKTLLIIASGLVGGLCAGFGALSGSAFRDMFTRKKPKSFYS